MYDYIYSFWYFKCGLEISPMKRKSRENLKIYIAGTEKQKYKLYCVVSQQFQLFKCLFEQIFSYVCYCAEMARDRSGTYCELYCLSSPSPIHSYIEVLALSILHVTVFGDTDYKELMLQSLGLQRVGHDLATFTHSRLNEDTGMCPNPHISIWKQGLQRRD